MLCQCSVLVCSCCYWLIMLLFSCVVMIARLAYSTYNNRSQHGSYAVQKITDALLCIFGMVLTAAICVALHVTCTQHHVLLLAPWVVCKLCEHVIMIMHPRLHLACTVRLHSPRLRFVQAATACCV
jgi:hypothetical protein